MADIKYSYAYDGDVVVHIDDVSKHGTFYCLSCGKEMVVRLGDKKSHHFAHKVNDVSCNSETYLHKLAKLLLKKKFQEGGFEIEISRYLLCKKSGNCLFEDIDCKMPIPRKYDLKRCYDTCDEEQDIDGFCADLLITGEGRCPILVEIYVSHKCSNQKINSGHRIIEIPIESEADIEYFYKNVIAEKERVRFYGFKRELAKREFIACKKVSRFILYKSGAAFVKTIFCERQHDRDDCFSLLELNMDYYHSNFVSNTDTDDAYYFEDYDAEHDDLYRTLEMGEHSLNIGLVYAVNKGFSFKNCHLCKYARDDSFGGGIFCCMSKKYGTPCNPNQKNASSCSYYTLNREMVREVTSLFSDIKISEVK